MSLVTIVAVPSGIAISAESRRTLMAPRNSRTSDLAGASVLWDREIKIHLLWSRILVASLGRSDAAGLPVSTHLRQLESRVPTPNQLTEVAPSLRQYFHSIDPCFDSTFLVVTNCFDTGGQASAKAVHFRLRDDAQTFLPERTVQWFGGRSAVEGEILGTLEKVSPPELERMDLSGAIDYSRHLIRTVIDQTRFSAEYSPVGGPIDTAVATAHGIGWVVRKPD